MADGLDGDGRVVGETDCLMVQAPLTHGMTNMIRGTGHGIMWSAVRLRASLMTVLFANLVIARFVGGTGGPRVESRRFSARLV